MVKGGAPPRSPAGGSTAAQHIYRGHLPWVTCLDQFGTRLAYHAAPESHMKTEVIVPKCQCPKGLSCARYSYAPESARGANAWSWPSLSLPGQRRSHDPMRAPHVKRSLDRNSGL